MSVTAPADGLPAGREALREIALDLRWTWSHAGDELWRTIDAETWELTRNPWWLLQMVPPPRFDQLAGEPEFRRALARVADERRTQADAPATAATTAAAPRPTVCYFSMEYGLGAALP